MCGSGYSDVTIKGSAPMVKPVDKTQTPEQQQAQKIADTMYKPPASMTAADYVRMNGTTADDPMRGFTVKPPADAPDVTSQALQARKAAQALAILNGRGRKQSFLGGDYANPAQGGSILGGG